MKKQSFVQSRPLSSPGLEVHEKRIIVAGLNDLNSQSGGVQVHGIRIGGLGLLEKYLQILKNNHPDNTLILSTGHLTRDDELFEKISKLPIDAFGLSAQESEQIFQDGALKKGSWQKLKWINSNIYQISSKELLSDESILPYEIFQIDGVSIAVMSIAPVQQSKIITGLFFQDPTAAILKTQTMLRQKGVDIIALISHLDQKCEHSDPQNHAKKAQLECQDDDPLSLLIKRLPPKSIDIILNTGTKFSFGKIRDTYIMNTPGDGQFLDLLSLVYDVEKESLIHSKTHHLGPLKLCQQFFKLTRDCYVGGHSKRLKRLEDSEFKKIPAQFLGSEI